VIGSEGRGVSPQISARAVSVKIPTTAVESLNAAVAAGVVLYEARRQRSRA
jgi:RNA methyltransferase, TrmH family